MSLRPLQPQGADGRRRTVSRENLGMDRFAATTQAWNRRVLPMNLLLDGRKALVVGGRRAAMESVRLLVEAGAEVTVASAEASDEMERLIEHEALSWLRREFSEPDLERVFLVFAASEDRFLNRRVVAGCRSRGVLCCSADGNWASGDFTVPEILRREDLTVAISDGGRASRFARTIKDSLSRNIDRADSSSVLVIGTSHEYLPLERREPLHLVGQRMESTGAMLAQIAGVQEFLLVNTCNRIELHALVSDETATTGVLARVLGFDRLLPEEYYVKRGWEAFTHIAMMSAGLFSQSPGEYHIVSQVKDSLEYATRAGWARGVMQGWVSTALHVSKEIRSTTGPLLKEREIEDLCLGYLEATHPDLGAAAVLVLGSGVVGSALVDRIVRRGLTVLWCYHLKRPTLSQSWAGSVRLGTFDDLRSSLAGSDVVICATDSPHLVLTRDHAGFFPPDRPVQIVDLTMPRNVDPELDGALPNLSVIDLEDLKEWQSREMLDMQRVFEASRQIVEDHRDLFERVAGRSLPVG
jgi:glutamyl-tRNA reductase